MSCIRLLKFCGIGLLLQAYNKKINWLSVMNVILYVKGISAMCLYWSSKLTVLYSNLVQRAQGSQASGAPRQAVTQCVNNSSREISVTNV